MSTIISQVITGRVSCACARTHAREGATADMFTKPAKGETIT